MTRDILILGGGVSGVTTGIVGRLLGHSVRIVCRQWLGDTDQADQPHVNEPRFASQYPAASIIPHSVQIADEAWHMATNLRFFEALNFQSHAGVRKQRHYEVYESPVIVPGYATEMKNYRELPDDGRGEPGAPCRGEGVKVYGWSFDTLFAEMPRYRSFLARLYNSLGGSVISGQYRDGDAITNANADVVINCGGAWGPSLYGDSLTSRFVKGILVRVEAPTLIPKNTVTDEVFSYNYHPDPAIYARPDGTPADVYFYPRTDGWLLGGTRLESVDLPATGDAEPERVPNWAGETWNGERIAVSRHAEPGGTIDVPAPLLTLNRTILKALTGHDLNDYPHSAMIGYRHKRAIVRLERDDSQRMPVVHNYGHGGAGVTLSWSCAIRAATLAGLADAGSEQAIETMLSNALTQ